MSNKIKPKLTYPLYSDNFTTEVELQNEIDNRILADSSLSTAISSISTGSLSTALSSEISTRSSGDVSLSTALSSEISTRSSADSTKLSISGGTLTGGISGTTAYFAGNLTLNSKLYSNNLLNQNNSNIVTYNSTTKEITYTPYTSVSVNYATTTYQLVDTESGTYVYLTNPISSQVWFTSNSDYEVCCDYATLAGTLGGYNFQYFNSPYQTVTSGSTVTINCSLSINYILSTSLSSFTIALSNYTNGTRGTVILNLSATSTNITISNTPTAYKNGTFTGLTSGKYLLEFWTDNNLYAMWRIAKYT